MDRDHHSEEWDDAPMPYSIFFTKQGHAIHGTYEVRHLGQPVSHGCVRLSVKHASILWDLVKKNKMANTIGRAHRRDPRRRRRRRVTRAAPRQRQDDDEDDRPGRRAAAGGCSGATAGTTTTARAARLITSREQPYYQPPRRYYAASLSAGEAFALDQGKNRELVLG